MLRALLDRVRGRTADPESGDPDAAPSDGESDADDADPGSVWDLIPSWQYDGRHVESGGVARDEQERALRDVQRQAEAIERGEDPAGGAGDEE